MGAIQIGAGYWAKSGVIASKNIHISIFKFKKEFKMKKVIVASVLVVSGVFGEIFGVANAYFLALVGLLIALSVEDKAG